MMDRRLKERLVGATLLVAVIVLVVPELLSGPKRPAVPPLAEGLPASHNVVVDLPSHTTTAEPDQVAASQALSAQAPNPNDAAPATSASAASEVNGSASPTDTPPASAPSVMTLKAQSSTLPPALETPPSSPKSQVTVNHAAPPADNGVAPHHAWSVQLGSFASKANAERLVHRLQASGGSFYVLPGGSGSSLRYRVRMGPLADRSAAEHALAKLKAQGHSATIVTPGA